MIRGRGEGRKALSKEGKSLSKEEREGLLPGTLRSPSAFLEIMAGQGRLLVPVTFCGFPGQNLSCTLSSNRHAAVSISQPYSPSNQNIFCPCRWQRAHIASFSYSCAL